MKNRTARLDGIEMRWEEHGTGALVVLVHGILTSPALWRHVVRRLEGCRCLAWEMVGYCASIPQGAERDISISAQADYLARWMKHLDLEPAIFAGHSLGGGVVQMGLDNADTRAIEDDLPTLDRPARIVWDVAEEFMTLVAAT